MSPAFILTHSRLIWHVEERASLLNTEQLLPYILVIPETELLMKTKYTCHVRFLLLYSTKEKLVHNFVDFCWHLCFRVGGIILSLLDMPEHRYAQVSTPATFSGPLSKVNGFSVHFYGCSGPSSAEGFCHCCLLQPQLLLMYDHISLKVSREDGDSTSVICQHWFNRWAVMDSLTR